jgi:hypothetical protein
LAVAVAVARVDRRRRRKVRRKVRKVEGAKRKEQEAKQKVQEAKDAEKARGREAKEKERKEAAAKSEKEREECEANSASTRGMVDENAKADKKAARAGRGRGGRGGRGRGRGGGGGGWVSAEVGGDVRLEMDLDALDDGVDSSVYVVGSGLIGSRRMTSMGEVAAGAQEEGIVRELLLELQQVMSEHMACAAATDSITSGPETTAAPPMKLLPGLEHLQLLLVPLPTVLKDRWAERGATAAKASDKDKDDHAEEQSAAALSMIRGLAGAIVASAAAAAGDDADSHAAAARAETLALTLTQTVAAVATNGMWKRVPLAEERLAQLEAVYRMRMMHDAQERRGVWGTSVTAVGVAAPTAGSSASSAAIAAGAGGGGGGANAGARAASSGPAPSAGSMGVGWRVARCVSAKASAWGGTHLVYGTVVECDPHKNMNKFEDEREGEASLSLSP